MTRRSISSSTASALAAAAAFSLAGCTVLDIGSDKIDYKSAVPPPKSAGIEVPPDLTQLTRDTRYQQVQAGSVSAAALQSAAAASGAAPAGPQAEAVATRTIGSMKIERLGNDRWLHTTLPPEQLWPQLQAFWKERGFVIAKDDAAAGVLETDWAENRGKLPHDFIRSTIGKVFDDVYSTGELDKFRTRIERSGDGTDIYITHRGMIEIYTNERKDNTTWQPRQPDPQLEGEFLSRLMLKLGAPEIEAKSALLTQTSATPGTSLSGAPARARILSGRPSASMQIDDGFDRAWRRVGVALDRSGFTVEDRDRSQGVYFVRYVDPAFAGKEEPNFFSKLFSFGKKPDDGLARYRVAIKGDSENSSTLSVFDSKGAPENGDTGKRITSLLLDELK